MVGLNSREFAITCACMTKPANASMARRPFLISLSFNSARSPMPAWEASSLGWFWVLTYLLEFEMVL